MNVSNEANEWAEYAEEDFTVAKSALRRRKPLTTPSCFHSQQCAEKYLKAMLVAKEVEFPKTHDLLILDTLCNKAGILTGFTKEDLGRLSGYAVHARYPGNQPTVDEARGALEIVSKPMGAVFIALRQAVICRLLNSAQASFQLPSQILPPN